VSQISHRIRLAVAINIKKAQKQRLEDLSPTTQVFIKHRLESLSLITRVFRRHRLEDLSVITRMFIKHRLENSQLHKCLEHRLEDEYNYTSVYKTQARILESNYTSV
jgi:hypothetical protein